MTQPDDQPLIWFEYSEEHEAAFRDFSCGDDGEWSADLNDHLPHYALEDAANGFNTTYVFYENTDGGAGVGYVVLCATSIVNQRYDKKEGTPVGSAIIDEVEFPNIPAVLVGRIAVRQEYQGKGYGKLILDWVKAQVLDLPIGCRFIAVNVQKKNKKAMQFYKRELFLPHRQKTLWLYDVSASAALLKEG